MQEKVVVTIHKDGTVEIDVDGVVGTACKDITNALKRRLGGVTLESRDKPQMYHEIDQLKQTVSTG